MRHVHIGSYSIFEVSGLSFNELTFRFRISFSYPMFALINLFVFILKNPASPLIHSDLALLDMVAGHFGHMEFLTSSLLSFPFARETASLARSSVLRAARTSSEALVTSNVAMETDSASNEEQVTSTREVRIFQSPPLIAAKLDIVWHAHCGFLSTNYLFVPFLEFTNMSPKQWEELDMMAFGLDDWDVFFS